MVQMSYLTTNLSRRERLTGGGRRGHCVGRDEGPDGQGAIECRVETVDGLQRTCGPIVFGDRDRRTTRHRDLERAWTTRRPSPPEQK